MVTLTVGRAEEDRRSAYRVGILLIDGFSLMSYASAVEPLRAANILARDGATYGIRHVPAQGESAVSSSGAQVSASAVLGRDYDFDLVLAVAGGNVMNFANERVFNWLRQLDRRGVELGGVSGGPAVLAAAGLMSGRRMTVHWEYIPALAERDPSLLVERSLFVFDRDRLTCAGGVAALDMMLALIRKHRGQQLARTVGDWFLHTEIRPSAGPQRADAIERYGTTNRTVLAAISAMETHIADPLDLEQLGHFTGASARQLTRLFKTRLGRSPMAFYRMLRLEKARNLLTNSSLSLTEVALATGFASSAHFSRVFGAQFGAPPSRLRQ